MWVSSSYEVAGKDTLAPGKHTIKMDFTYDGGGIGRGGAAAVSVDGKEVAKGRVERTIPIRIALDETLDVGEDCGTPVNLSYDVPFKFSGKIEKVTIGLGKGGLAANDQKKLDDTARVVAAQE
ncbi:MAG: hypothetical protein NTZ32_17285 [Planctomycetales bacterium]|nr:hypothetical protein [Planctomycetales bacterium]